MIVLQVVLRAVLYAIEWLIAGGKEPEYEKIK